jgi:hypothetical protein
MNVSCPRSMTNPRCRTSTSDGLPYRLVSVLRFTVSTVVFSIAHLDADLLAFRTHRTLMETEAVYTVSNTNRNGGHTMGHHKSKSIITTQLCWNPVVKPELKSTKIQPNDCMHIPSVHRVAADAVSLMCYMNATPMCSPSSGQTSVTKNGHLTANNQERGIVLLSVTSALCSQAACWFAVV